MLLVTASIKQPGQRHGRGYWPAFWMLGPGPWPVSGEIDILEDVDALSQHSGTLHCGSLGRGNADGTDGRCHERSGASPLDALTSWAPPDERDQSTQNVSWRITAGPVPHR